MSFHGTPSASPGVLNSWSDPPRPEVNASLQRILESSHFRTSKKCTRFLSYIVAAALDGRFDCLKERSLGVDVFDREPNYDTNQDPIVRGTAGEVRKRLAQYYQQIGAEDEYRISLPAGSYVPDIHRLAKPLVGQPQSVVPPPQGLPAVLIRQSSRVAASRRLSILAVAITFTALAIAIAILFGIKSPALDRFWAPLFEAGQTPLVCMGQPQLYTFRPLTALKLNSWFSKESARQPPMSAVPMEDIVPMWRESVSLSDAQAFARLSNFFAGGRRQFEVRGEAYVSLSDLLHRPAILIGAFDNDWTLSLGTELRFFFDVDSKTGEQVIRDRQNSSKVQWRLADPWPPTKKIHVDYALATRVVNRTTEQTIVVLAGISEYGTAAAAEFLTSPNYFSRALQGAPQDWKNKNIQVVLSTRVLAGTPGPPAVVAVYFW